jgi:hypothetical protein
MRADNEPSPFKCVKQEDVDLIFAQILRIPDEIRRMHEQVKPSLFAFSKKKDAATLQEMANDLVAKAQEIYNSTPAGKPASSTNPDLWQHEEKQKQKAASATQSHQIISHAKTFMSDVRPITNIDDLNNEIDKLKNLPQRNAMQNKKLTLLERQRKIFEVEKRIVPEAEIDHYSSLARKYAELLNLLDNAFEKGRSEKSIVVKKNVETIHGNERKDVKVKPEISEVIQYLNDNPDKDHYLRMVTAILKEKFSDESRHLFTGIAFYDTTGVYNNSAFARRRPFKELVVPETYQLLLQNKNEGNVLRY